MATTETIAQHAGSAITDFGEAQPGLRAEIAEDCSSATVIWIETLNWHREYDGERFATLQDTDGSFTSEASKEMADYVKEFLAESEWNVPNADIVHEPGEEWDDEDEPNVAITYRFGLPRGEDTTMEEFMEVAWPFIGAMKNLTDPGTFNNPYLITELARRIAAKPSIELLAETRLSEMPKDVSEAVLEAMYADGYLERITFSPFDDMSDRYQWLRAAYVRTALASLGR